MNHLEKLIRQAYEYQGYIVRGNVKVGRLAHGGYEGELDIVSFHPESQHLIHLEPSIDANTWEKREQRFAKKFAAGRKYICSEVFPWLPDDSPIEQVAVLISSARKELAGAKVISIDEFIRDIREKIQSIGKMANAAIPEEYDLLRTIQMVVCGYYKLV